MYLSFCPQGGGKSTWAGNPGPGTPPGTRYPSGTRYTPKDQVHPSGTRYTPHGTRYTPHGTRYPPQRDQVHPSGTRYTPPGAVHAGRYGQQADGTHPTGMHSCMKCVFTTGSSISISKNKHSVHSFKEGGVFSKSNFRSLYFQC